MMKRYTGLVFPVKPQKNNFIQTAQELIYGFTFPVTLVSCYNIFQAISYTSALAKAMPVLVPVLYLHCWPLNVHIYT